MSNPVEFTLKTPERAPKTGTLRRFFSAKGELNKPIRRYEMAKDINEMTMQEIRDRAIELGFKVRKNKEEVQLYHWNFSQELKAFQFVKDHDPELAENEEFDDFPDDAA